MAPGKVSFFECPGFVVLGVIKLGSRGKLFFSNPRVSWSFHLQYRFMSLFSRVGCIPGSLVFVQRCFCVFHMLFRSLDCLMWGGGLVSVFSWELFHSNFTKTLDPASRFLE